MEIGGATVAVYVREVADGYLRALDRFDDATINRRPPGPATNSAAVLVTHAWASARYWIDHVGLGRPTARVRDDEFTAVSTVADLKQLVLATADDLAEAVMEFDRGPGTAHARRSKLVDPTDGSLVFHMFEELFQHLGHLDLTADAVV